MKRILSHIIAIAFIAVFAAAASAEPFAETVTEADGPGVTATPADQWKPLQMQSMSGGSVLNSDIPGAALEFDFNGAGAAADLVVGKSGGMMAVYVDGKKTGVISLYRNRMNTASERIALANGLAPGAHKVRIEVLAEHHPKSFGFLIAVDTFRAANVPYAGVSGTLECRYNEGMPAMRAKVTAAGKDGETTIVTDTGGGFSFSTLAPGSYTLRFEHPGFSTLEKTDLALDSVKTLALGKVLFEEKEGARPLALIRYPLGVRPVIVRPGDGFGIEAVAPDGATGWQASLETAWAGAKLEVKKAGFNTKTGRWTLAVVVPKDASPSLLYGLRLKYSGGEDFQPRAVMVVPVFKDSIKVIHLTDVHVYKSESLFDVYSRLANEINLINPDLIVITGDLTDSNGYTDERWPESDQYPAMLDLWNSYNSPTFIVPGNHDLSPHKYEDDYQRWRRFFDVMDFSFDAGPYHFTAFDNAFTFTSGMRDEAFAEDIFPEQLDWIDKDLAAHADAKMRVLLYHVPLHNTKSKVKELAKSHKVRLALYGHLHMNQVDKGPTTYVQTGAAFEGFYRVVNLENGKLGELNAKKDSYSAFSVGTLKSLEKKSEDGRTLTLRVKNSSIRAFPGASWRAEMPSAANYSCEGCKIVSRFDKNGKNLVVITFDIPAKGEIAAVLKAE